MLKSAEATTGTRHPRPIMKVDPMTRTPLSEPKPHVAGFSPAENASALSPPAGRLLTPKQVSEISGLSVKTLANLRCLGGGAPYFRIGGGKFVRYDENELATWMRSRRFTSTSQESAG